MYQLLQLLVIPTHVWYLNFPSHSGALSFYQIIESCEILPPSIQTYRIHVVFKENALLTVEFILFLAFELVELSWGFTRFLWCVFKKKHSANASEWCTHSPPFFCTACCLHCVILHSAVTLRNRYVESQQDAALHGLPPRDQEEMGTKRSQSKSELVLNLGNASHCFLF